MYQGYYGEQHISKCDTNELKHKTKKTNRYLKNVIRNIFSSCGGKYVGLNSLHHLV